ncbi:MAG: hypothetical protein AAFV95_17295 [Bacteroidota bacterium]
MTRTIYACLLALLAIVLVPTSSEAMIYVEKTGVQEQTVDFQASQNLSLNEFLNLSPKAYKKKTGKKLKLRERIVLKMAQKQIKKKLKKNEAFDANALVAKNNSNFHLAGFLLGFFLGLIGFLIALLVWREDKAPRRSALKGLLLAILLVVILQVL